MANSKATVSDFNRKSFDFLIVGGGTAGLAVAARLSANPHIKVGVLEAGSAGPESELSDIINIPGNHGHAIGSDYDWKFETTHQPGLGGRAISMPRGKVLGGTSALNFMTWNRASRQDYDAWRDLGNEGWGWDDLLPFFKKSEAFHPPHDNKQEGVVAVSDAVGSDGPIQISYPPQYSASHAHWHATLNALGVETNTTHFSGSNVGVWTNVSSVDPRTAARSYATTAYYLPNASRPNLFVLTEAEVTQILLDHQEGEWVAKGARFLHSGGEFEAYASREVIISAGSIQSPQLLELSGIGDAALLSQAGISVKINNPNVGEHLQDHLMASMIVEVDPKLKNMDDLARDPAVAASAREEYAQTKSGPLTILPSSLCYVPFPQIAPHDVLVSIAAAQDVSSAPNAILRQRFNPDQKLGQVVYIFILAGRNRNFTPSEGKKYGTMIQVLQYPFSKGSVHIRSSASSPRTSSEPIIDPRYFDGDEGKLDLDMMVYGHRFAQKICSTKPLADVIRAQVFPDPSIADADLRQWLMQNTLSQWHPVGTCSMGGSGGIHSGVVDERLRVYGTKGLRVVDASIMPLQISGHPQATIYAIAEKAAHMIMEDTKL